MFEQTFKNIDSVLHKDAGADSELDYIGQTSWVMFLRYLDELERDKADEAGLQGLGYQYILADEYQWSNWAMPKGADELPFRSTKDKHELSYLYETKIRNMGNAGRNGGQYYTPRPLIRAMINVIDPQMGEKVYDGAAGSCGFLCETYEYMSKRMDRTTDNLKTIQEKTFYGKEKKNLAYVIGIMNMILHGIEAPNIIHTNTLGENIRVIQEKDRFHVILANPPFGGGEHKEVQQKFPFKTGETAFLFLQHFIKSLKAGGRAAIVIKNTFLSNTDNAAVSLRKHLLDTCNLHTVLDMPGGTFLGAGVKTVVLFFQKGEPTLRQGVRQAHPPAQGNAQDSNNEMKSIWYYQLNPGRNMGKTNPLNDKDMAEFIELQASRASATNASIKGGALSLSKGPETERSWNISVSELVEDDTCDLSVKNPNTPEEAPLRSPQEILAEMEALDKGTNQILQSIKSLI